MGSLHTLVVDGEASNREIATVILTATAGLLTERASDQSAGNTRDG